MRMIRQFFLKFSEKMPITPRHSLPLEAVLSRWLVISSVISFGLSSLLACNGGGGFVGTPEKTSKKEEKKDTSPSKDTTTPIPKDGSSKPDSGHSSEGEEEPKTPEETPNSPSEPSSPNEPKPEPEPGPSGLYDPLQEIKWTMVKDYGGAKATGSSTYTDVVGHTDPNDQYTPRKNGLNFSPDSVAVHETGHMLHFQVRNLESEFDETKEGIYYKDGKGVVFTRPKLKISDIRGQIPEILKDKYSPYELYLMKQPDNYDSHNHIAYLFNEWGCYIMNIKMLLELEEGGNPEDSSKGHAANHSPYFFGYLAYGIHNLKTSEPSALQDKQFKAAFALYAQETWDQMRRALKSPTFGNETTSYGPPIKKFMTFYQSSSEFAAVKGSLVSVYGKEWVDHLMRDN